MLVHQLVDICVLLLIIAPGIPILVFCVECLAATLVNKTRNGSVLESHVQDSKHLNLAVLVPAHNEAADIEITLSQLKSELGGGDRLIVIADNCDDDTATIARLYTDTVLERFNPDQRGKGHALAYGLSFLQDNPPDIVVIVDADCSVAPQALRQVADLAYIANRPVQSKYLMMQPSDPTPKDAMSALAFLVKNWVRLEGLSVLGLPCLLTGTGMAFPWAIIKDAPLASGNIVEDMQLGLDLSIAGYPPLFCPEAQVIGRLPNQAKAAKTQRTRWEHGHLKTLLTQVPRLVREATTQRRPELLAIALDLCVPPISLLIMLWFALLTLFTGLGLLHSVWWPMIVTGIEGLLIGIAVIASWYKFSRDQIPARALMAAPLYVIWKIPLYFAFLVRPQNKWVRTQRN